MKKDKRAREVVKLIRSVWSSLESHLRYTHKNNIEGRKFHKKCVRDYSRDIHRLSKLL